MKKIITTIIFFLCINNISGQCKDPISVNVEILATLKKTPPHSYGNFYYARFEVTNNEDTTLPINIWGCSWGWNWKSDHDSIFADEWGCDANSPTLIEIFSKQTYFFYGGIRILSKAKAKNFKMGFASIGKDLIRMLDWAFPRKPKGNIYWSNSIILRNDYPQMESYVPYSSFKKIL